MKRLERKVKRFCYGCGSDKSWVDKDGHEHWLANKPTDLWICHKCRARYIYGPIASPVSNPLRSKELIRNTNRKRMHFKDKSIRFTYNPRKGICKLCGSTKLTHMHHKKYHDEDPLKDTIELCNSCHTKETWKLGQMKK